MPCHYQRGGCTLWIKDKWVVDQKDKSTRIPLRSPLSGPLCTFFRSQHPPSLRGGATGGYLDHGDRAYPQIYPLEGFTAEYAKGRRIAVGRGRLCLQVLFPLPGQLSAMAGTTTLPFLCLGLPNLGGNLSSCEPKEPSPHLSCECCLLHLNNRKWPRQTLMSSFHFCPFPAITWRQICSKSNYKITQIDSTVYSQLHFIFF